MKKNKLLITIGAVVALVVIGFLVGRNHINTDNVFRIGVILPLTGSYSNEGLRGLESMSMAAEEINNNTNLRYKVNLIFEDDKYTSKDSVAAANKILLGGADAFISFGTPPTQAIKERINRESIPLLAMDGSAGLAASSKWIFECFPQLFDVGSAAGRYSKTAFSPAQTALLTMRCSGGDDFARGFTQNNSGNVTHDVYDPDAMDARPQITKLLQKQPDVFCVFGYGAGYTTVMSQLLESGYTGIILTDSNLTSILDKLSKSNRDIYFVSQNFGPATSSKACSEFMRKMQDVRHVEPTVFSAHLYEMVKMLSFVAEQNSKERQEVRNGMAALHDYPSMFGPMSFDEEGSVHLPFSAMKYTSERTIVLVNGSIQ